MSYQIPSKVCQVKTFWLARYFHFKNRCLGLVPHPCNAKVGNSILLVTNYGETRSSLPYVEPVLHQEQRRRVFALGADSAVVEILGEPCEDIMSGEQFPASVTIRLSDTTLEGCGRALLQK